MDHQKKKTNLLKICGSLGRFVIVIENGLLLYSNVECVSPTFQFVFHVVVVLVFDYNVSVLIVCGAIRYYNNAY